MSSRRRFLGLSAATLAIAATRNAWAQEPEPTPLPPSYTLWLPLVQLPAPEEAPPMPLDMPIVGESSVTVEQAARWITDRALRNGSTYSEFDIRSIVEAYQTVGAYGTIDWGLALAQMCHETGTLSSWWSARPRRNPAGIGVTGRKVAGTPDTPPLEGAWAWDGTQWCEGVSFSEWAYDAVIAHLGRLLAYAMRDEAATPPQLDLIQQALAFRRLPLSYRGIAPTIVGLNGRWAVPGTTYGQSLIRLVGEMRKV